MLLFWCFWFTYRFIKLDLLKVGKFCSDFSYVLGSVVYCVSVNPIPRVMLKPYLTECVERVRTVMG